MHIATYWQGVPSGRCVIGSLACYHQAQLESLQIGTGTKTWDRLKDNLLCDLGTQKTAYGAAGTIALDEVRCPCGTE